MKYRCDNASCDQFHNYGGRGIRYDSAWSSFDRFFADMGECPPGYSLERVDVDANYCPENCIWLPLRDQSKNRRNNRIIRALGIEKPMWQWAEDTGIPATNILCRLQRGWSPDDAVSKPVRKMKCNPANWPKANLVTFGGETRTLSEWSKFLGVPRSTLASRLKRGWSVGKALSTPRV